MTFLFAEYELVVGKDVVVDEQFFETSLPSVSKAALAKYSVSVVMPLYCVFVETTNIFISD